MSHQQHYDAVAPRTPTDNGITVPDIEMRDPGTLQDLSGVPTDTAAAAAKANIATIGNNNKNSCSDCECCVTPHQRKEYLKLVGLTVLGLAEGFTLAGCGVIAPQAFRDQMVFRSFLIMKLFLAAVGFSMIFQAILSVASPKKFESTRFYSNQYVTWKRTVPGCLLLGAGMYIAGSGPTMLPSQLFSGVRNASLVLLGGVLGGALFGMVESRIVSSKLPPS